MKLFKFRHLLTLPALLNIAGIAVAVAAFYVLLSVVSYDLTFNHSINEYDKIYNLSFENNGGRSNIITRPMGEQLGRQLPGVESFGCLHPWVEWSLYAERDGKYRQMDIRTGAISKELLKMFSFEIVEGDTSKFNNMDQVIISRRNAERYDIQVGEHLKYNLNKEDEIEVVAIYDIAPNTELEPFGGFRCIGDEYLYSYGWSVTTYYYKMSNPINEAITEDDLRQFNKSFYFQQIMNQVDTLIYPREFIEAYVDTAQLPNEAPEFMPLSKMHFATAVNGFHEPANPQVTYTLLILAVVIIVIAYINYINFFLSRVPQRIKSINTMKIFGSSRQNLVNMLVGESVIFTLVSMVLAFVLVYTVAPALLGSAINMDTVVFSNYKMLVVSILLPIITSIAVSIFPALHITVVDPALALKGSVTKRHDFALRYILISVQILASTVLIIASMFIHKNMEYITATNLGFNSRNLLGVETSQRISQNRDSVRTLLLQNPDIIDVAWTHSEIIAKVRHNTMRYLIEDQNTVIPFDMIFVSDNFFDFMGIEIVEGRGFTTADYQSENGVYILNQYTRDTYDVTLQNHIGNINGDVPSEIVGFCNDIKFKPLHYPISPLAYYIPGKFSPDYTALLHLYIRIQKHADVTKTKRYIAETLAKIDPDFPFIHNPVKTFEQEMMDSNYNKEIELARMISLFAFIAILISVMGIFGIVYFETERRRKEIGIRRVNGATIWEILSLFNVKFLKISAISSIAAIPSAYLFVQKYFSGFAYHYPVNVWVFVWAVFLTVVVTLLVVTAASFRAASENPVRTLKNDE